MINLNNYAYWVEGLDKQIIEQDEQRKEIYEEIKQQVFYDDIDVSWFVQYLLNNYDFITQLYIPDNDENIDSKEKYEITNYGYIIFSHEFTDKEWEDLCHSPIVSDYYDYFYDRVCAFSECFKTYRKIYLVPKNMQY